MDASEGVQCTTCKGTFVERVDSEDPPENFMATTPSSTTTSSNHAEGQTTVNTIIPPPLPFGLMHDFHNFGHTIDQVCSLHPGEKLFPREEFLNVTRDVWRLIQHDHGEYTSFSTLMC